MFGTNDNKLQHNIDIIVKTGILFYIFNVEY